MSSGRRYIVHGLVQGVGFRWFTQKAAQRLAVRGAVTNRPDGAVEVHADGDDDALAQFERELHRGPMGARVDRVDIDQGTPIRDPGFRIR